MNALASKEWLNLYTLAIDGSGEARRLTEGFGYQFPDDWSKDGRHLIFTDSTRPKDLSWGIFELDLPADAFRTLVNPRERQAQPTLSPDGLWIAYTSRESGRNEVYIAPYPDPSGKLQVSTEGGRAPTWSPNGRRLYFLSGNRMMAAEIETGPRPSIGAPELLFEGDFLFYLFGSNPRLFDIAPDGKHFVMIRNERESEPTEFRVVQNWFKELERLVPTN
jgi:Tol biopolymer transport system component